MSTTRTKSSFVIILFAASVSGTTAQAGVILGLIVNPATTSGVATSTRSGVGSWQVYAIEDTASSDLGIASYNLTMTGTTAINHRSPTGTAVDGNGDTQNFGFSLLRSGTNANPIVASEPLSGTTPFVLTGFGLTAGTVSAQVLAADSQATVISPTTGASWGTYNSPILNSTTALLGTNGFATSAAAAMNAGHKWVFLAEGLGATPSILTAAFTVLSNTSGTQVASTLTANLKFEDFSPPPPPEPEPATVSLVGLALFGGLLVRLRR